MALRSTNKTAVVSFGSLSTIYQYTGSRWANIKSLQLVKYGAGTQTLSIVLVQSSQTYYLAKDISLTDGMPLPIISGPITLKAGDDIKGIIHTGSANSVTVILSIDEFI